MFTIKDLQLGRFWQNRGDDGIKREKQLLIDYLCSNAGGSIYYIGRDMKLSHMGMKISESDWSVFLGHAGDTLTGLSVPQQECDDAVSFVLSLKDDIVGKLDDLKIGIRTSAITNRVGLVIIVSICTRLPFI